MKRITLTFFLLFGSTMALLAQDPNDCSNALTVCGNANLSFNSSGPGINDFATPGNPSPGCGVIENQSLWLRVPIQTSGTLGFVVTPNGAGDDYDFAVFGPDVNCLNLGAAIRCSFADPNAAGTNLTGLRAGEIGTSEGSDPADGFLSTLDVVAGETYLILIDNFFSTNSGFDLTWTGTAVIAGEPEVDTPVVPSLCDAGTDGEEPFDLTTLSDVISRGDPNIIITYHNTQDDAILGNNPIPTNQTVRDGTEIFARGTFNDNGCAATTSITFTLDVGPENVSITGPPSVCPDVNGVMYSAQGASDYTYEWFISGGTITNGATNETAEVSWGTTNDSAFLKVLPTNGNGCVGDTVRLDITINTRLEPPLPDGPVEVCTSGATEATYSVPLTPGSAYDWMVENGTLISPNGNNEVTVRWNGDQPGRISFMESNPAITDCEGTSPVLTVSFLPAITASPSSVDVSCFGEATGAITLNPGGGEGALTVQWNDGVTGANRTALAAGVYNYTITDVNNCELSGTINIAQPEELVIAGSDEGNLFCFEDNTGFAEVTIAGGTPPYRYQWQRNGANLSQNQPRLNGLSAGTYTVSVTDANNCAVNQQFVLTEPTLLEPDLDQLINVPICPQTSDGEVTVGAKGGTPDYTFAWQLNPEQTGATATGLARGNYTVVVTDANGCTTSQEVEVTEQFPRVYIPNAFSPNGDGKNDVFRAISHCPLGSFNIVVFSQWGTPVFSTDNIGIGWTGALNGKKVPLGSYTYLISYSFQVNGKLISESIRGGIRLIK